MAHWWYSQGAAMGLVANWGADNTKTFTGWRLRIVEAEIRSISFLVLHIPLVISNRS
jgi:hypothetical protein